VCIYIYIYIYMQPLVSSQYNYGGDLLNTSRVMLEICRGF
jgi:hypothetical protein